MPAPTDRQLLDQIAMQAVVSRYFQGVDRNDLAQMRACFTADVKGTYANRGTVVGVDEVLAMLRSHFENMENGTIRVCTHFMGTFNIDRLEGDSAETETYALAFLVRAGAATSDPDAMAMRSLRYLDRWKRTAEGWKICERIHTLDWSCKQAPDFATTMAKRLMRLPGSTR